MCACGCVKTPQVPGSRSRVQMQHDRPFTRLGGNNVLSEDDEPHMKN